MAGPAWLTHDLFAHRVGERFEVAEPSLTLELTETEESSELGGPGPDGQARRQFSLTFGGPPEPALAQATYTLAHAELGDLDIFLVPVGRDETRMLYEAAFA